MQKFQYVFITLGYRRISGSRLFALEFQKLISTIRAVTGIDKYHYITPVHKAFHKLAIKM